MKIKFRNYIDGFTRKFVPVLGVVLVAVSVARLLDFSWGRCNSDFRCSHPDDLVATLVADLQMAIHLTRINFLLSTSLPE